MNIPRSFDIQFVKNGKRKKGKNLTAIEESLKARFEELGEEEFERRKDEVMQSTADGLGLFLTKHPIYDVYQFCLEDPKGSFFG